MDDTAKLRDYVQEQIANSITQKLKSGELSQERARQIAQMVLDKLPSDIDYQELIKVIPTLDDQFQELSAVIMPIVKQYEQDMKIAIDKRVHELIQSQKFDEALKLTKQAIEFDKSLR